MHNSVVEDLESLSKEITFTQGKVEEVDKRRITENEENQKNFLELEAFINTLIFSEKAARTAMTGQLSDDIDRAVRDYTKKIDDVANYCEDMNEALESATNNLGNLDTEHTNFYYEFQAYKDTNENNIRDIVIRMAMEKMVNMLETYNVDVKTVANRDRTIVGRINLQERAVARGGKAISSSKKPQDEDEINELVDRKLDKVYERIRNDNWVIWKESIRLTEKEFSENGIQKTNDFLPKVTYDKNDLKRQINTLMFDDAEQMPKPIVKTSGIRDNKPRKEETKKASPKRDSPKRDSSPPKGSPKRGGSPKKRIDSEEDSDK